MQVLYHGIGLPASEQLYGILVDSNGHQSHGATSAQGSGRNVGRQEAEGWTKEFDGGS
jgi:hypothetical protein